MSSRMVAAAALALAGLVATSGAHAQAAKTPKQDASIERGRYLAKVAGCNDCHTPGYAQSGGAVPETDWLVGDAVGWKGPWGTTYPANLRLALARMSEDQWVKVAHGTQYRPPMPWFALRDMSEADLRALYRFVRALGPAGQPAPAYVPPGQTPAGAVITFPEPPKHEARR